MSPDLNALVRDIDWVLTTEKAAGLQGFSRSFDAFEGELLVAEADLRRAYENLDQKIVEAMTVAANQIRSYHKKIAPKDQTYEDEFDVQVTRRWAPFQKVGVYTPGGNYPLFSSLLMSAIPAQVAGCREIVVCSPPSFVSEDKRGIHPLILATCYFLGIKKVYNLGGAQAILAMARGVGDIPKCNFICGPGNKYVTAAKEYVRNSIRNVGIDLPAGPSEILVAVDGTIPVAFSAADLLSQAEHDVSSRAYLCGLIRNREVVEKVVIEFWRQTQQLGLESKIGKDQLVVQLFETEDQLIEWINDVAPEHAAIHLARANEVARLIDTAGTIFVGPWTAETFGDYINGPSHVLPTNGAGAVYAGLSTSSFGKFISIQCTSKKAFQELGPVAVTLAEAEGLVAHAYAIKVRND
jgi:histidinol dehydrogenase